jgi:hypothetical protein
VVYLSNVTAEALNCIDPNQVDKMLGALKDTVENSAPTMFDLPLLLSIYACGKLISIFRFYPHQTPLGNRFHMVNSIARLLLFLLFLFHMFWMADR